MEITIRKIINRYDPKCGRGFSHTNLKMMRLFHQNFPIRQTLSDESVKEQKPEAMFGKSATQQTLSVKSQKQRMLPTVSAALDTALKFVPSVNTQIISMQKLLLCWESYMKLACRLHECKAV